MVNLRKRLRVALPALFVIVLLVVLLAANLRGQQSTASMPAPASAANSSGFPPPMNWTADEDHQNMMDQLGINALRPGPSANENAPNHVKYHEPKPNPLPDPPYLLTLT